MIRLFIEKPLQHKDKIDILDKQAHYLAHVMRVKAGDTILLFNGVDGEWQAKITEVKKNLVVATCESQTRQQTVQKPLRLLFAPIKRGHGDYVIEKATELGVTRLSPIFTQHTIVNRVPLDRYRAIAIEAAEQCERLNVPEIDEPQNLQTTLQNWDSSTRLIFCAESGEATAIAEALKTIAEQNIALLVGPEGGFSKEEFAYLRQLPFVTPVHLGSQILRADTAAISALAVIQAIKGHWLQKR